MTEVQTLQKLVAHVRTKLLAQGRKALDASGMPTLFGPGGARCALGWCFEGYDEWARLARARDFAGTEASIDALREKYGLTGSPLGHEVLSKLLCLHDHGAVHEWPDLLAHLEAQLHNARVLEVVEANKTPEMRRAA